MEKKVSIRHTLSIPSYPLNVLNATVDEIDSQHENVNAQEGGVRPVNV